MWRLGIGGAAAGAAGLLSWQYSRTKTPFPVLSSADLASNSAFLLYNPAGKGKPPEELKQTGVPVFSLGSQDSRDLGINLAGSSRALHFVRKIDGSFHANSLDLPSKYKKWVALHQELYSEVNSREDLEFILKSRPKFEFLSSLIVCYVPEDDPERSSEFEEVIFHTQFVDIMNSVLISFGNSSLKFVKTTNRELAIELGLVSEEPNGLVFLRVKDSRGWFHSKKPRNSYADNKTFYTYIEESLSKHFKVSVHKMQLDLQLYCDKYYLGSTSDPMANKFSTVKDLSESLSRVDPLICPLWSVRDLQLIQPKLAHFLMSDENKQIVVISVNQDHDERSTSSFQALFKMLKLEEFARTHRDTLIVMGYPQMIYHLPIRDLAIYHFDDVEVRAFWVKDNQVQKMNSLEPEMTLEDLISSQENHWEAAPIKTQDYAEILTADSFHQKILSHTERCYFVMNCSKNCPACMYQDPYFQLAARESEKCSFAKYYVSNQSPYFKGPNATPTYQLYVPGQTEPIVYEPKKNGIAPEKFLSFIDSNIS